MSNMKLIVGLGNPGKQYERTRHNVGFFILDRLLSEQPNAVWSESKKTQALYSKIEIAGKRVELFKPQTFMNNSGISVAYTAKKHGLTGSNIIVIHDDKDIPLGNIRVQIDRGAAGHNGVLSVIEHLGTKDFLRIRVGVAPKDKIVDTASFVLGKFTPEEQKTLNEVISNVITEIKKQL